MAQKRGGDKAKAFRDRLLALILDVQGVGVHGFLAGYAFEAGEEAAVIVLIRLNGNSALLAIIVPSQADVMLFRFRQQHERTNSQRNHGQADRSTDSTMNVLTIT